MTRKRLSTVCCPKETWYHMQNAKRIKLTKNALWEISLGVVKNKMNLKRIPDLIIVKILQKMHVQSFVDSQRACHRLNQLSSHIYGWHNHCKTKVNIFSKRKWINGTLRTSQFKFRVEMFRPLNVAPIFKGKLSNAVEHFRMDKLTFKEQADLREEEVDGYYRQLRECFEGKKLFFDKLLHAEMRCEVENMLQIANINKIYYTLRNGVTIPHVLQIPGIQKISELNIYDVNELGITYDDIKDYKRVRINFQANHKRNVPLTEFIRYIYNSNTRNYKLREFVVKQLTDRVGRYNLSLVNTHKVSQMRYELANRKKKRSAVYVGRTLSEYILIKTDRFVNNTSKLLVKFCKNKEEIFVFLLEWFTKNSKRKGAVDASSYFKHFTKCEMHRFKKSFDRIIYRYPKRKN